MLHAHDPRTGRHCLTAPHTETALGITIARPAGYVWHAGKWPVRIRTPSDALRRASFWHDGAYEDLPWTWGALARADLGFIAVYVRHGGTPARALILWCGLALWSSWTAVMRTKS